MDYEQLIASSEARLFIIGEAGVNHNGKLETAFQLVDAAIEAGCDAVKFQTWITEKVYSPSKSRKPAYQLSTTSAAESEFTTIKKLELSFADFERLHAYCRDKGVTFFSTPDEIESADFLARLGVRLMKTASQDVTNLPLLHHVSRLGMPVIYSTGGCTLSELAEGVDTIRAGTNELVVMHCVSSYPAPVEEMNLSLIPNLRRMFGCPVGLSDHTTGFEAGCAAVALGARIFEKHLTLSNSMPGPDHQASLEPGAMREYCKKLRAVHSGLGDGVKRIMPCEEDARRAFRRFIVAGRNLRAGTVLKTEDLQYKKVGDGIPPRYLDLVIGSELIEDVAEDTIIGWEMFRKPH